MITLRYPLTSDFLTSFTMLIGDFDKKARACLGLNTTQCRLLLELSLTSGSAKTSALARELAISPSSVTVAANALEPKRLIERRDDPSDRRHVIILLTPAGEGTVESIEEILAGCITNWWSPLDSEQQNFLFDNSVTMEKADGRPVRSGEDGTNYDVAYFDVLLACDSMLKDTLRDVNLSRNEFRVMFELYGKPRGLTVGQASNALLLHLSNIRGICDGLVERGHLVRKRDHHDRRSFRIWLSESGEALLDQAVPRVENAFMTRVPSLSADTRAKMIRVTHAIVSSKRAGFRSFDSRS